MKPSFMRRVSLCVLLLVLATPLLAQPPGRDALIESVRRDGPTALPTDFDTLRRVLIKNYGVSAASFDSDCARIGGGQMIDAAKHWVEHGNVDGKYWVALNNWCPVQLGLLNWNLVSVSQGLEALLRDLEPARQEWHAPIAAAEAAARAAYEEQHRFERETRERIEAEEKVRQAEDAIARSNALREHAAKLQFSGVQLGDSMERVRALSYQWIVYWHMPLFRAYDGQILKWESTANGRPVFAPNVRNALLLAYLENGDLDDRGMALVNAVPIHCKPLVLTATFSEPDKGFTTVLRFTQVPDSEGRELAWRVVAMKRHYFSAVMANGSPEPLILKISQEYPQIRRHALASESFGIAKEDVLFYSTGDTDIPPRMNDVVTLAAHLKLTATQEAQRASLMARPECRTTVNLN